MPDGTTAPRWWRLVVTAAVGCFVAALLVGSWSVALGSQGSPARVVVAVLASVGVGLLAGRRRFAVPVLAGEVALAAAAALLSGAVDRNGLILLVVLALYMVAATSPPARTVTFGAVAATVVTAATGARVAAAGGSGAGPALGALVPGLAFLAVAVAVGVAVRSQRALLVTFRERAEQAEREQRWGASRAVAAERVRIARELHDVVAHHVSLLVVQAGAVRETLDADHVTRPVLDSMIDGGRQAMGELRGMLGALRLDDRAEEQDVPGSAPAPAPPSGPRAPQPTIDTVPALVAGARAAGLPVTLRMDAPGAGLPPAVALSAYRIVQEALTNAVKHAPGAFTSVVIHVEPSSLVVTVRNGPSPGGSSGASARPGAAGWSSRSGPAGRSGPAAAASGHGLTGMRERVALCGGSLVAGPHADGWEVVACLPTTPVATAGPMPPPAPEAGVAEAGVAEARVAEARVAEAGVAVSRVGTA